MTKYYTIKPLSWSVRGLNFIATSGGVEFILSPMGAGWGLSHSIETSLFKIWSATLEEGKQKAEEIRETRLLDDLEVVIYPTRRKKIKINV